jgi:hypothetical protein
MGKIDFFKSMDTLQKKGSVGCRLHSSGFRVLVLKRIPIYLDKGEII